MKAKTFLMALLVCFCLGLFITPLVAGQNEQIYVVKKGDTVKTGQVIGEAAGSISLPVHASGSGKVVDVCFFPHPLFRQAETVVIESDGADVWEESVGEPVDIDCLSPDQMREAILKAGVAGMGGAAFPTHVKLSPSH